GCSVVGRYLASHFEHGVPYTFGEINRQDGTSSIVNPGAQTKQLPREEFNREVKRYLTGKETKSQSLQRESHEPNSPVL
ncbi:MAG: hypothetical protein WAN72_14970, partial [Candidatus Acidiferrales bacterium]